MDLAPALPGPRRPRCPLSRSPSARSIRQSSGTAADASATALRRHGAVTVGLLVATLVALAGCGSNAGSGADGGEAGAATSLGAQAADGGSGGLSASEPDAPTTPKDAARFLQQATFGPDGTSLAEATAVGPRKYLLRQLDAPVSVYSYTLATQAHRAGMHTVRTNDFCATVARVDNEACWRDYYSSLPVQYEFFRQATANPDQLRQRMAFALSQIFVTSGRELDSAYGFAHYHQMLRDNAFGNFRTVLERVITSPFMGTFLNLVDNEATEPNENFARELLQLFTIGTCQLEKDGSLRGGACLETYSNETVRNYAFALTGWTYPAGGVDYWCNAGCQASRWTHPRHYRGAMVGKDAAHDKQPRMLLSGITAPAGRSARQGLDAVLDSLLAHPNTAPFIGRQLIQFFVTSNPSPAYVARVARAFDTGLFDGGGRPVGTGRAGDLRATMAAVLLDDEARSDAAAAQASFGRLREPVQYLVGAIRALDGRTDGDVLASDWAWSGTLKQTPFHAPSVFNYYPPDFPLAGTSLVAPQLGAEGINSTIDRVNYANALIWWYGERGTTPDPGIADATGTRVDFARWERQIVTPADSTRVLDAIDLLLLGGRLTASQRSTVAAAMDHYTPAMTWLEQADPPTSWRRERVRTAFYLLFASPQYQVQR